MVSLFLFLGDNEMKKIGNILINIILVIAFMITCAGTFAEKSVGFGIATIIVVVLFILNIRKYNKVVDSKKIKELDNRYATSNWQKVGSYDNAYLYINENDKKVLINNHEYNFKDIISAEFVEDEKEYTNSYTRQSALSSKSFYGSSSTTKFCTKLQIKIVINSMTNPQEYITFINKRTWKSRRKYKDAYNMAQKFISTLQVIISNNKSKND